jgi:hypothetical protein
MHGKERAIAPPLETALGVHAQVPPNFNTDRFGTFTRDVKRPADQLATARLKAQAALDLTGATLAIASEGSFGPHPDIPFVPCDRELVLLLDREHNLEIIGQAISTNTNYRSQTIRSVEEALAFATAIGFPEHGLVVMPQAAGTATAAIAKGLTTTADLTAAVETALASSAHPNRPHRNGHAGPLQSPPHAGDRRGHPTVNPARRAAVSGLSVPRLQHCPPEPWAPVRLVSHPHPADPVRNLSLPALRV